MAKQTLEDWLAAGNAPKRCGYAHGITFDRFALILAAFPGVYDVKDEPGVEREANGRKMQPSKTGRRNRDYSQRANDRR